VILRELVPEAETESGTGMGERPELESRLRRSRSARISAALWQRRLGSFSRALLMSSSSLGGKSGFNLSGGAGARFKMASKIIPDVSPRNGSTPVDIS